MLRTRRSYAEIVLSGETATLHNSVPDVAVTALARHVMDQGGWPGPWHVRRFAHCKIVVVAVRPTTPKHRRDEVQRLNAKESLFRADELVTTLNHKHRVGRPLTEVYHDARPSLGETATVPSSVPDVAATELARHVVDYGGWPGPWYMGRFVHCKIVVVAVRPAAPKDLSAVITYIEQ